MRRFYSKFGPLSWYRWEWIRLCISFGDWLIVDAAIHHWRAVSVLIGGKVIRRSMFGQPSCMEPKFAFYFPKLIGSDDAK